MVLQCAKAQSRRSRAAAVAPPQPRQRLAAVAPPAPRQRLASPTPRR